jgi:hypothetical protein
MLVAGAEMLEEWVEVPQTQSDIETTQAGRLGDLFAGVLTEMGFLRGEYSVTLLARFLGPNIIHLAPTSLHLYSDPSSSVPFHRHRQWCSAGSRSLSG